MGDLWPYLERIAALLEPDERESVLGDIQQRGANLRTFLDLIGLVLLRQIHAWKSWQPWVMAASLYIPARFTAFLTHPVASVVFSGHLFTYQRGFGTHLIHPWEALAAPIFSWAIGFSLGYLGRRRAATLLPIVVALFAWEVHKIARITFREESALYVLTVILMLLVIVIPFLHGFVRGVRNRPLSLRLAIMLVALCTPAGYQLIPPADHLAFGLITAASIWPFAYALAASRRTTAPELSKT